MTGVMGEILKHYGQTVTLRSRDGEKSVRAFIQPAATRNEAVPGEQTPIGWIDERLWRYTGLEEVQPGDTVIWQGTAASGCEAAGNTALSDEMQSLAGLAGARAEGGGMKELSQIRNGGAGGAARRPGFRLWRQFPEKQAMAYSGAVAAVGVGAASGKTAGFCHYLGEMKDPETQAVRERYGKELFGADHRGTAGGSGGGLRTRLRDGHRGAAGRAAGGQSAPGNSPGRPFAGRRPLGCSCGGAFWNARALFLAESAVESGDISGFPTERSYERVSEMRHERPGVYSVYDASSVTSAGRAAKRHRRGGPGREGNGQYSGDTDRLRRRCGGLWRGRR